MFQYVFVALCTRSLFVLSRDYVRLDGNWVLGSVTMVYTFGLLRGAVVLGNPLLVRALNPCGRGGGRGEDATDRIKFNGRLNLIDAKLSWFNF